MALIHALAGALAALRRRAASRFPGAVPQSHESRITFAFRSATHRDTSRCTTGSTDCRDRSVMPCTSCGHPQSAAQSAYNACQDAANAALLGPSKGLNIGGASFITSCADAAPERNAALAPSSLEHGSPNPTCRMGRSSCSKVRPGTGAQPPGPGLAGSRKIWATAKITDSTHVAAASCRLSTVRCRCAIRTLSEARRSRN